MSKPWFHKISMEGEPTPLRETIGKILSKDVTPQVHVKLGNETADKIDVAITNLSDAVGGARL